jgi:hypothetical protein
MRRFFKATDGHVTVFRASDTRDYKSAFFTSTEVDGRWVRQGPISFSGNPIVGVKISIQHPAVEIVQSEYETLIAGKNTRVQATGGDPRHATSPQHSWVSNAAL